MCFQYTTKLRHNVVYVFSIFNGDVITPNLGNYRTDRVGIKRRTGIRKRTGMRNRNAEPEYGSGMRNRNTEPELGIKRGIEDKKRNYG